VLDPQSPEVHNLLGFTAALAGETDEALEHYKQAIALDETYLEAMLNAAEVLMHPIGDFDDAIAYCNDALEYAETPEEIADCILLKVDALLGKGDTEEAKRALMLIPEGPFENPNYTFLVGRAFYEVGDLGRARPLVEEAAKKDAQHPDAHYYLGLARDEEGDAKGAVEAFLRSRAIDMTRPPAPWSPTSETFTGIVQQAVARLDAVLGAYVRNAEMYVVDVPGAELVVDGVDPRALLILDTPPASTNLLSVTPKKIGSAEIPQVRVFIYQRNAERAAGSLDALEEELFRALEREITAVFLEREPEPTADPGQLN
jgi:tetratricopeptide (TPR) repeat protein